MGLCFGIHILGYYPDFDTEWPVVMWDENRGPVEVSWPIDSQDFTVYKNGTGVMQAAANSFWWFTAEPLLTPMYG